MCNINLFHSLKGKLKDTPQLFEAINVVTAMSFEHNNHGEGYFALGSTIKTAKTPLKMIYRAEELGDSFLLATHQRIATSGLNNAMLHPHEEGRFMLIHNGVFSGIAEGQKSDTRVYLERLSEGFKSSGDLIKAINKLHKSIYGYFSIVVYDQKENKLLYYKNHQAEMYKYQDEDFLFLSTSRDNLVFMKRFLGLVGAINKVKSLVVFDILNGFKKIGKVKDTQSYVKFYSGYPSKKEETQTRLQHQWGKGYLMESYGYSDDEWERMKTRSERFDDYPFG